MIGQVTLWSIRSSLLKARSKPASRPCREHGAASTPSPASHSLRNAMKLMPGVVQDPTGGLHFQGGAEYQTRYTLDGFDITDPIDGRYSTRLAVEGVRSLDLVDSRESPNVGNGSAGTLAIQ